MSEVSIRELRHRGGDVVDRAAAGETVIVTRDGKPVAQMRAIRAPLSGTALLRRWANVPAVSAARLRADVDSVLDPRL